MRNRRPIREEWPPATRVLTEWAKSVSARALALARVTIDEGTEMSSRYCQTYPSWGVYSIAAVVDDSIVGS